MIELDKKYVFHIPLFKYVGDELISIDINDILDELLSQFKQNGHDSAYLTNVKSFYKSRNFDELLITIFTSSDIPGKDLKSPDIVFKQWFGKNNNILQQEAFAYEYGNSMLIVEL